MLAIIITVQICIRSEGLLLWENLASIKLKLFMIFSEKKGFRYFSIKYKYLSINLCNGFLTTLLPSWVLSDSLTLDAPKILLAMWPPQMASTSPIVLGGPLALLPFLRLLEQHTEKAILLWGSFNIWIWCSPQVSYNPLPQRVWLMYISISKNWFGGSFSLVMASISPL